jgi:aminoglycoside phosphotransferase (APT) family kinase protein
VSLPELLASGRDASVFAIGGGRVLRRYHDARDALPEAEVMAYLTGHGYPVPTVHSADGGEMVMERLVGPTMVEAIAGGDLAVEDGARILAGLHDRLHVLPARRSGADSDRVLHLDLHPENVILTSHGPVVIDWPNATDGPPDLDVAMTALILAQVAVDPGEPRAALARAFLATFQAEVTGHPVRLLERALVLRGADPNLTEAERAGLPTAAELIRATCPEHG